MFVTAILCIWVLVYTYFLYPIVIALCARLWPSPVRRDPGHTPYIAALIPVYNAKEYIREKLDSLLEQDYPSERLDILLCSDCSTDGSDDILAEYAEQYPKRVRVFRSPTRSGKPSALNLLAKETTADVLLMTDIRQPLAQNCVRELASYLADPNVGAVSGNLVLKGNTGAGFYWKYEKWIREREARFRSVIGVSGSIYAVRASGFSPMPPQTVLDDMWVPMRLRLQKQRVLFAGTAEAYDEAFEDEREFGRKTRTLFGNYQLVTMLPKLLLPWANASWFEFISHKVLRLVCPWALLVLLLVSSVALFAQDSLDGVQLRGMQILFIGQVAFYLLAILGRRFGKVGNIARTFVVLNIAALVGLWKFVRQTQRITW